MEEFFPGLEQLPIARVELLNEQGDIVGEAGSLTDGYGNVVGRVLAANHEDGSDDMAAAILSKVQGFVYRPYEARNALINPAAELGDGVTVRGVYSVIASENITLDGLYTSELTAPTSDEIDEYPYVSPMERMVQRNYAKAQSLISKTSEEIRLEVQGVSGEVTALSVTLEGVTITGSDGQTLIKGSSIDTSTIRANSISADQVNLSGSITFGDLSSDVAGGINDAYEMASDAYNMAGGVEDTVQAWSYGGSTYIDGSMIMAGTVKASNLLGGSVGLLTSTEATAGLISITGASTASYAVDLTSYGALRITASSTIYVSNGASIGLDSANTNISVGCLNFYPAGTAANLGNPSLGIWGTVYASTTTIQPSDRNLKNSIEDLPKKYVDMVLWLAPKRFKMNNGTSDRYHVGFIAQEVKEAMDLFGIDPLEFAGWCKDIDADGNDIYMLRYGEFIAILLAAIQNHEERLKKLEGAA